MAESKAILIVDDEPSMCEMLEVALKKWGYRVKIARTLREAMAALERGRIDGVLSDIKLPDGTGVELLTRLKTLPEKPPVLLMTAFGNTDAAVQAMKMGAFYYVTKPFKLEELRLLLERSLSEKELKAENQALKSEVKKEFSIESLIGKSKPMKQLVELIERVSQTKTNILITGESGTGKELVARAIHYGGPLKNKPFVAVNCGAIPENLIESELFGHKRGSFTGAVSDKDGLFQVANSGTIFLDEVGELPMSMQVKLLRVLQDRSLRPVGGTDNIKVDVRVISATNRNLEEAIQKGSFREDLYYRLNVINIRTPALRDRKQDIPELMEHFVRKFGLGMGKPVSQVSPEALEALLKYDFPGNVRELENMMERAMALEGSSEITVESLPPTIQRMAREPVIVPAAPAVKNPVSQHEESQPDKPLFDKRGIALSLEKGNVNLEQIVGEIEREYILRALEKTGGVKKKAAELLGITFRSIRYRITKYGIQDTEDETEE
ncbi:MAG: sigma-54 dependent transcriptional regulator [Bdellovibrionota bacterium]